MYYYVYNLQGDVTHIIDSTGAIKGTYQYDAWGKLVNFNSLTSIAQINPFRYRGYYYDTESGLYYLNSRYYNAEWGRFINADGYVSTGQGLMGYNMFAYCNNNPIMYADYTGAMSMPATFKLLKAVSSFTSCIVNSSKSEAQQDKFIENSQTIIQSVGTSILDEYVSSFANWLQPASVLGSTNTSAIKSFGAIADSYGVISAITTILQIGWDYETYKDDPGSFAISAGITVLSTVTSVGLGALIVASEITLAPALAVTIVGGLCISFSEDALRKWLLE